MFYSSLFCLSNGVHQQCLAWLASKQPCSQLHKPVYYITPGIARAECSSVCTAVVHNGSSSQYMTRWATMYLARNIVLCYATQLLYIDWHCYGIMMWLQVNSRNLSPVFRMALGLLYNYIVVPPSQQCIVRNNEQTAIDLESGLLVCSARNIEKEREKERKKKLARSSSYAQCACMLLHCERRELEVRREREKERTNEGCKGGQRTRLEDRDQLRRATSGSLHTTKQCSAVEPLEQLLPATYVRTSRDSQSVAKTK